MSTPPTLALPRGAQRLRLTVPGATLAAVRMPAEAVGARRARGTAVLVHGFTGSKEDFLGLLEPLARHAWDVLAFDLRGHFESDPLVPHPDGPDGREYDFAADIAAVLAEVRRAGTTALHVVGHSLGGLLVRRALVTHAAPADSVTLLASGPAAPRPEAAGQVDLAVDLLSRGTTLADLWSLKRAADAHLGRPEPADDILAFLQRRWVSADPAAVVAAGRTLLQPPQPDTDPARLGDRPHLQVLVAAGELEDNWTTGELRAMAEHLGARWVLLPGIGHSPAAEDPAVTADLLDAFWSGRPVIPVAAGLADRPSG